LFGLGGNFKGAVNRVLAAVDNGCNIFGGALAAALDLRIYAKHSRYLSW
jgi:hypothetical protein